MLMDLLATICAGAGLAGIVLALRYFSRNRLPKWTLPAAIGAGMLIFSVWNEYSWYPRVSGALPDEVIIVSSPQDRVFYRPWTYLFPVSSRFMALDRTAMLTSAENAGFRRADALIVQRWAGAQRVPLAFDCAGHRRADLVGDASLAPDGALQGAAWQAVGTDDALQQAACREG
ncbi:hypothetical protein GEU84_012095 [Fertoebacter nigrum]|uniref:Uncharacterized protein n=1 Tax=Fertoeibacter niger TaxID=2656921 RepID=A0A8X8H077_9RHOB|nr:hypothetical protein [Fertoeibacter niger]NUB45133.1 hypothetical protein [Fertoeibacter niger]